MLRSTLALLLLLSLAGCSTADDGALTLVESKSPVQLLRNEAWLRLPDFIVKESSDTIDVSVACDDDGFMRSWKSSTIAQVNNSFAPRTAGVVGELVESFELQGWTAEESDGTTLLTREGSLATISVHLVEKTSEHRASIEIETTGPCVQTDGADSDEVRTLEGRS